METADTNTNGNHQTRGELREKTREAKENLQDVAQLAQGAAGEFATEIKEKGQERLASTSAALEKKMEPTATYIKKHPVRSLLMGVGTGILLGTLMSGKKRSE